MEKYYHESLPWGELQLLLVVRPTTDGNVNILWWPPRAFRVVHLGDAHWVNHKIRMRGAS